MVGPLKLVLPPPPKDVEVITVRLPDGTLKQVTREKLEGAPPPRGGKK